jgi:uncharacterized protein (TIGR03083 family)
MPRPQTKAQLITESQQEYEALESLLAGLPPEQMVAPGALGEWSVKDVLAHLYEWQQMLLRWYEAGLRGETPPTPADGYKWNQLSALNQRIYEQYLDWPLDQVLEAFRASHHKTFAWIQSLPEADLLTPGLYPWMKTGALIGYISSNTGNHYRWARSEMGKALRPRRK